MVLILNTWHYCVDIEYFIMVLILNTCHYGVDIGVGMEAKIFILQLTKGYKGKT